MNARAALTLGSVILVLGLSCGGKVESSSSGGSGGTVGNSCDAMCAKCDAGSATCVSQCNQAVGGKCGSLFDAAMKCAVDNACASLPCQSKLDAYSQCAVGGKGGSGGTGGSGGGYGGSGGTTVDLCDTACTKCGGGQPDCAPTCKQSTQGQCGDLYSAIVVCVLEKQCDAALCEAQTHAYVTCVTSGTGGTGGGYGGYGGSAGGWGGAGANAGAAGAGGASCEAADPLDGCAVCAAAKCCAEWIACADDGKCADVFSCAMSCDAGTFEDCLQLCSPDYNPKVSEYYTCVWIEGCAAECQ